MSIREQPCLVAYIYVGASMGAGLHYAVHRPDPQQDAEKGAWGGATTQSSNHHAKDQYVSHSCLSTRTCAHPSAVLLIHMAVLMSHIIRLQEASHVCS